jgi:hypothetical protein
MDFKQYQFGCHREVGYVCHFPESHYRFGEKALFPHLGSHAFIIGTILGAPTTTFGSNISARIPIDIAEIEFLTSDSPSKLASPAKG